MQTFLWAQLYIWKKIISIKSISKSQNKTKGFSSKYLDTLNTRKAYFDPKDPNSIKNKVKKTWKDRVTTPVDDYADDDGTTVKSYVKRTPAKIARTTGSAIKTAYNKAFKKPET